MNRYLETIKVENGVMLNIILHNKRLNQTIKDNFNIDKNIDLNSFIKVPTNKKTYRCRVEYSNEIEKIEFIEQNKREFKIFKIVYDNNIDYKYKSLDREKLNHLLLQKDNADEIIIVKNDLITDTSISNIAILDDIWYTPKNPLLNGTQREKLINEGILVEKDLSIDDLKKAKKIAMTNAILEFFEISDFKIIF